MPQEGIAYTDAKEYLYQVWQISMKNIDLFFFY